MVAAQELTPNPVFAAPASAARIERVAAALEANGFRAIVVESGEAAREVVLDLLPAGAEVFDSASRTLESLGIADEIARSDRHRAVRPQLMELYARGERDAMRKLGATPDVVVGSVHAVTEQGQLLIASGTGSQLGPYAYGAGAVIWVVGAQKLVRDLDEGLRRIDEYSYPLEDARARQVYGKPSAVNKILIVNREGQPGRATVVLVNEPLGF